MLVWWRTRKETCVTKSQGAQNSHARKWCHKMQWFSFKQKCMVSLISVKWCLFFSKRKNIKLSIFTSTISIYTQEKGWQLVINEGKFYEILSYILWKLTTHSSMTINYTLWWVWMLKWWWCLLWWWWWWLVFEVSWEERIQKNE